MRFVRNTVLSGGMAMLLVACGQGSKDGDSAATAPPPIPPAETEEACVLTPPAEPMACTMQYDPVCGCDGKTYGNACMAQGAGVPRFTTGECEETGT